jgi:hypothetical protein
MSRRIEAVKTCLWVNFWHMFLLSTRSGHMSRGRSVSIASDYELDNWMTRVWSPAGAKDFSSSLCIQTGCGAYPASYQWVLEVLSPGVKHGWGVMLTTHPHLMPRSRMSRSYTSSPPLPPWCVAGQLFFKEWIFKSFLTWKFDFKYYN